MTNDDIRRIAAEVKRELRDDVRALIDTLRRVERKVDKLDERVDHLENDKLRREVRENERDRNARLAAEIVATKAAKAISDRERSRKWWLGVASAVAAAVIALTTLTSILGQYIHSMHP